MGDPRGDSADAGQIDHRSRIGGFHLSNRCEGLMFAAPSYPMTCI
jgi:hypothetical protein